MSGEPIPRAGVPAATIPTPTPRTATPMSPTRTTPRARPALASPPVASRLANRPMSSAADRGSGTTRSRSGRAAHIDDQPGEQADLRPELVGLRRHQERAGHRDQDAERDATDLARRGRLRVRDHEEQEDHQLGRQDDHPPVVEPADRREGPVRDHAVAGAGEQAERERDRDPEGRREHQELEPPRDHHPAGEDDGVGREHPDRQRRPPEVERLDHAAAEHDEGDDQPDVGRVEDVRSAVADDVLGEERERGDAREDVPAVGAPRLVRRRADDPQDERDAAPGEHRAGRPDEGAARAERQDDLDDRRGQDRREDLRDADLEPQHGLPQHVDRDDHGGDVETRIAGVGEDQRVAGLAERERPGGHAASGRWIGSTIAEVYRRPVAHAYAGASAGA